MKLYVYLLFKLMFIFYFKTAVKIVILIYPLQLTSDVYLLCFLVDTVKEKNCNPVTLPLTHLREIFRLVPGSIFNIGNYLKVTADHLDHIRHF